MLLGPRPHVLDVALQVRRHVDKLLAAVTERSIRLEVEKDVRFNRNVRDESIIFMCIVSITTSKVK